jgi:hypothetical protein
MKRERKPHIGLRWLSYADSFLSIWHWSEVGGTGSRIKNNGEL